MYRAVSLYALRHQLIQDGVVDCDALIQALDKITISFQFNVDSGRSDTMLNGENVEQYIRSMEVSSVVSAVSAIKEVRTKLVALQHQLGKQKGVVMDGRDIGTVVFPNAELKIFMTAAMEVRAMRRYEELKQKGSVVTLDEVRANLEQRDYKDTHRKESPLMQAEDAVVLDNTDLTRTAQLELAHQWALERIHAHA